MAISEVSKEEIHNVIESRKPLGKFLCFCMENGKKYFIGVDNSTGNAWTEVFTTEMGCKQWLEA